VPCRTIAGEDIDPAISRLRSSWAILACHHKILQLKYEVAQDGKMPNMFLREGLTVAIYRKTRDKNGNQVRKADFSYHPNDSLAHLIVDAWVDSNFRDLLLNNRQSVKSLLAARGFYLQNPVVIKEETYYQDYEMQDDNEVVFVLPQQPDALPPCQSLLETARLLMSITPNGI
jgi:hypothetical protein